jgi:hypothetical protein
MPRQLVWCNVYLNKKVGGRLDVGGSDQCVCARASVSVCVRVWGVKSLEVIYLVFRGFCLAAVKIHDTHQKPNLETK